MLQWCSVRLQNYCKGLTNANNIPPGVFVHKLHHPSIKKPDPMTIDQAPQDAVIRRIKGYVLVSNKLYKRGSAIGVLMKCVLIDEGKDILWEIHDRTYGNNATSHTLVRKAFRSGFYWPTALADAEDLVRRCTNSQFFGKQAHVPTHNLITIRPSCPFAC
jgi:hypothetical protein